MKPSPRSNGLNAPVPKPEVCHFEVRLGDFVREGQLTAQMASNAIQVGELVVELKRCPEQNRYPTASNSRKPPNNRARRPLFETMSENSSYLNDLNESDLSVPAEKFRISAKDQLHFLVNDFSKRCRLRKKDVKAELLAFKRAVLRDYSNRLMKFSMTFETLTLRQNVKNAIRSSLVNGAVPNGYSHKPEDTIRTEAAPGMPKVSGVQSVEQTQSSHVLGATPSRPGLSISGAAKSQLLDQFISLSPPIQRVAQGVRLGVARKTLKRPISSLSLDPAGSSSTGACRSSVQGVNSIPAGDVLGHQLPRPVAVKRRPVVPFPASLASSVGESATAQASLINHSNASANAVVDRYAAVTQLLTREDVVAEGSIGSTPNSDHPNQTASSSRAPGIPQIVSVTTLAEPQDDPASSSSGAVSNQVETETEIGTSSAVMATGSITGSVSNVSHSTVADTSSTAPMNASTSGSTDSAIGGSMLGEDQQVPAKKVKEEPIYEPGERTLSVRASNVSTVPSCTLASDTSSSTATPQGSAEQDSDIILSGTVQQQTNDKPFKCWICGFRFSAEFEIDDHLRRYYQNNLDTTHTSESITAVFNLDNPRVFLFCESGCIFLKCLFCEQVLRKLSVFLIHNMMHCTKNPRGEPQILRPASTARAAVFDIIKIVDSNLLPTPEQRSIIAGANEISICSRIECGSLLNKFDSRPHRKCPAASTSDPTRLKCKFADCSFEADKKKLISHYTTWHLIYLSNVNLQQDDMDFLNSKRSRIVARLIDNVSLASPPNHGSYPQNGTTNTQFPNQDTQSANAPSMGYRRDTIFQGSVPQVQHLPTAPQVAASGSISTQNPNNAAVAACNSMPPGSQQINSHVRPRIPQHTTGPPAPSLVSNYNQFYSPQSTNHSGMTYTANNYQTAQQNVYPQYAQQQQQRVPAMPQQWVMYRNQHPQTRPASYSVASGGQFRTFTPLVTTQQPPSVVAPSSVQTPATQHMQHAFGHPQHLVQAPGTQPQVQNSQPQQQEPSNNSGGYQYINWS